MEENLTTEFKEVTSKNAASTIIDTVEDYVVAFLNGEGGRIFWGIRDVDRCVVGISLDAGDRDRIRRGTISKGFVCFGREVSVGVGAKIWSNAVFLRDITENHCEHTRDDWHPEDHALYPEESVVAKDVDIINAALLNLGFGRCRFFTVKRSRCTSFVNRRTYCDATTPA